MTAFLVFGLWACGRDTCEQPDVFLDRDGDGFGSERLDFCDGGPTDRPFATAPGDCHDDDKLAFPGSVERCNAQDDDCDGRTDEEQPGPWYPDDDGDGWGDASDPAEFCLPGRINRGGDCDDGGANRNPNAPEVCDTLDNDCDSQVDEADAPSFVDGDGDGYGDRTQPTGICGVPRAEDCDDDDDGIHPGVADTCNGVDDDCDGLVDGGGPWFADDDRDGWGDPEQLTWTCSGASAVAGDCNDSDDDVHPSTSPCTNRRGSECDECDAIDSDCDGVVDEDAPVQSWLDTDGDGYGDDAVTSCDLLAGWAARGGDCAPDDPARNPGALETCDGADQDCDGTADEGPWYADADADGFGDPFTSAGSCGPGVTADASDCDDDDPATNPLAVERCDGLDEDCDDRVDDEPIDGIPFWVDADGDGYGDPAAPYPACGPWPGTVPNDADCDDSRPTIFPGAEEQCNSRDDDCNGEVDDGTEVACGSGHATMKLETTDSRGQYCGSGARVYYTYLGELPYDECEFLANVTGSQWYVGIDTDYERGWIGDQDATQAVVSNPRTWGTEILVDRTEPNACVLGLFDHRTEPSVSPVEEYHVDGAGRSWVFWVLERQTHSQAISFADDRGARIINPNQVGRVGTRSMTAPTHWCHAGAEYNGGSDCNTDDRCTFYVGYWE